MLAYKNQLVTILHLPLASFQSINNATYRIGSGRREGKKSFFSLYVLPPLTIDIKCRLYIFI